MEISNSSKSSFSNLIRKVSQTRWIKLVAITVLILLTISLVDRYNSGKSRQPNSLQLSTETTSPIRDNSQTSGISLEEDRIIPPIPPGNLQLDELNNSIEIRWQGTGLDIGVHYIIYRRQANVQNWEAIAIIPTQNNNRGVYSFSDKEINNEHSYEYTITIVDTYGKESPRSEVVSSENNP